MKILIADDELMSRYLLEKTLERAGYQVVAVENGSLAAEHLCKPDGPRLALLDWIMPELDGPSVCRQVRTERAQPYVYMVLLTSKESKQDTVTGLESGADDYLVKPWDPEELKARLRTGQRISSSKPGRTCVSRPPMILSPPFLTVVSLWICSRVSWPVLVASKAALRFCLLIWITSNK